MKIDLAVTQLTVIPELNAVNLTIQPTISNGGGSLTAPIVSISKNGVNIAPDINKNVDIEVPTATSELTNDSDFIADSDYATDKLRLSNTSGTNTGDQDLSGKADLVNGIVPSSQLPSYVDDVIEVANFAALPAIGESGKIYITQDDNLTYRWSGTGYAEISKSLALGETSSTAYRGDRGKTAYDHSQTAHAPSDAEKNIIVGVQKNGVDLTVDADRKVNLTIPTQASDIGAQPAGSYVTTDQTTSQTIGSASARLTNVFSTSEEIGETANSVVITKTGIKLKGTANVIKPNVDSTTAVKITKADGTTAVVTVDTENGRVGINDISPEAGFKVISPFGEFLLSDSKTGAKVFRFGIPHFSSATPVFLMTGSSYSGNNDLQIGGGSSRGNAVTTIKFYTAATNEVLTGTARMIIFPNGKIAVGYTTEQTDLFAVNGSSLATTAKGGTTTDYVQNDANGIRLFGAATQYNDIDFPLIVKTTGANLPTRTAIAGNVYGYTYAVNDCLDIDSTELNHAAKAGATTSKFHVHIVTNGLDATNRYVRFTFEYLHANMNAVMAGTTVGAIDLLIPANTADRTHLIFDIGDYTNLNAGSQIVGRFCRVASVGTAPTNNPFVLKFQLHSEFDKLGTNNITTD